MTALSLFNIAGFKPGLSMKPPCIARLPGRSPAASFAKFERLHYRSRRVFKKSRRVEKETILQCINNTEVEVDKKKIKKDEIVSSKILKGFNTISGQEKNSYFSKAISGSPEPMGASYIEKISGVNFSLFSSVASSITLVLFTESDLNKGKSTVEIELDPFLNRTGDIWHIALPNLKQGLLYGYRVGGPKTDESDDIVKNGNTSIIKNVVSGQTYDLYNVLIDPYAKCIIGRRKFGKLGPDLDYESKDVLGHAATWPQSACYVPTADEKFDWEGDKPLNLPLEDLVIYEMHVRGFTIDKSSQVKSPGTYYGLQEKLDYLKSLGVNCIELLPVHEFNELEYYKIIPGTNSYRFNFWGYSTVNFFSPMSRYSAAVIEGKGGDMLLREFKEMVKQCHKRGIEVILDVVYNHTAEGNHLGPSLSFRGLDNRTYYMLAPAGEYYNYSGCGNTFNANHPITRQFILDSLRYWVLEMHIDGFRFDLASILTRAHSAWHPSKIDINGVAYPGGPALNNDGHMSDGAGVATGTPLTDPALIEMISEDPVLRSTKLIAEAWDCGGLNQVGAFPHYGGRWAEWNGKFRDVVRNFIKGTDGPWAGDFASVLCGSPDLYKNQNKDTSNWWRNETGKKWNGGRGPMHSVNFVTAHDGFTLADLVSYNKKHNEANGENNNDGESHNCSWNCGEEGLTTDAKIQNLRIRQICNFFCVLFISHGVPMMLMGDEYGHTKQGNNNTYCHDSELNWFNWDMVNKEDGRLLRFVKNLIKFRLARNELRRKTYITGNEISWHGENEGKPDWSEKSRMVAFSLQDENGGGLYVAFNSAHFPRVINLPLIPKDEGRNWELVVDTGAPFPYNFMIADKHLSQEQLETAKALKKPWLQNNIFPMMPYSCIIMTRPPSPLPAVVLQKKKENEDIQIKI